MTLDKCRHVRQAITKQSLFTILSEWCQDGAGKKDRSIQILSAFVSGGAMRALSPLFDVFLADGNRIEIIFGIDRNGTDREAVVQLAGFQKRYAKQADVFLFNAPSQSSIFHPKLFLYSDYRSVREAVIGSANFTLGGLASNFESLLHYSSFARRGATSSEIREIWKLFRHPAAPLRPEFLSRLSPAAAASLVRRLPVPKPNESPAARGKIVELWRPLSRVRLPRSSNPPQWPRKTRSTRTPATRSYLLMDVLQETRRTQMQIPLPVVSGFFGASRDDNPAFRISILTDTGTSQPVERPLVATGSMRRLEMPTIEGLTRPLAVLFIRMGKSAFAYRLIAHEEPEYQQVSRILDAQGQQGRQERRFVIGRQGDKIWKKLPRRVVP